MVATTVGVLGLELWLAVLLVAAAFFLGYLLVAGVEFLRNRIRLRLEANRGAAYGYLTEVRTVMNHDQAGGAPLYGRDFEHEAVDIREEKSPIGAGMWRGVRKGRPYTAAKGAIEVAKGLDPDAGKPQVIATPNVIVEVSSSWGSGGGEKPGKEAVGRQPPLQGKPSVISAKTIVKQPGQESEPPQPDARQPPLQQPAAGESKTLQSQPKPAPPQRKGVFSFLDRFTGGGQSQGQKPPAQPVQPGAGGQKIKNPLAPQVKAEAKEEPRKEEKKAEGIVTDIADEMSRKLEMLKNAQRDQSQVETLPEKDPNLRRLDFGGDEDEKERKPAKKAPAAGRGAHRHEAARKHVAAQAAKHAEKHRIPESKVTSVYKILSHAKVGGKVVLRAFVEPVRDKGDEVLLRLEDDSGEIYGLSHRKLAGHLLVEGVVEKDRGTLYLKSVKRLEKVDW